MKTITEQLIAEKELLSDPSRWTKGEVARDSNGKLVETESATAVCWCQLGASMKLQSTWRVLSIKKSISTNYNFFSSLGFNDHPDTTHSDLMKFYDECIKESKRV